MTNTLQHELDHNGALQLLPWHVQGTLEPNEAAAVTRHLDECVQCREEALVLQRVFAAAAERNGAVNEQRLDALLAKIDHAERSRREQPIASDELTTVGRARGLWQSLLDSLRQPRFALPAAGLAAGVMAVMLFLPTGSPPPAGEYEVHSAVQSMTPELALQFANPPDGAERAALLNFEGVINARALTATEYRLDLVPEADVAMLSELIKALESRPNVVAAEVAGNRGPDPR